MISQPGQRVVVAHLVGQTARLRVLKSYLDAVSSSLARGTIASNGHVLNAVEPLSTLRVSARASVSGSAVLDGFCIIEPGAVIEDGAVVHDSVVLWGATVGGGSVVSRSVVGPLASVEPRARLIHTIASRGGTRH
jgi:NDP-sugar pyrophosphorylase family protein